MHILQNRNKRLVICGYAWVYLEFINVFLEIKMLNSSTVLLLISGKITFISKILIYYINEMF